MRGEGLGHLSGVLAGLQLGKGALIINQSPVLLWGLIFFA